MMLICKIFINHQSVNQLVLVDVQNYFTGTGKEVLNILLKKKKNRERDEFAICDY